MNESDPLFFADLAAVLGFQQCEWCGEYGTLETIRPVQLDEAEWVEVCGECVEGYDWRHVDTKKP